MVRRVYLHIGAPKTGTSYVQHRLTANSSNLAEHGVLWPRRHPLADPVLTQFRAALDLRGQDWGGPSGHARGGWDALVRRIKRHDGNVIVSHEVFAPADPDQVRRALRDLGDREVHVVYCARDLGRQVPAAWQESVKQGGRWNYPRFSRRMAAGRHYYARAFDLPTVLSTWGADLPPQQVHVVTVPHERSEVLWARMCTAFGIEPAWAPHDTGFANPSMGIAETQVLRRLNRRLDRDARFDASYDRIVREKLAQGMLANRRGTRVTLPPDLHPWAVAEAERWSAWITRSGVDLIGDLAELHPAPPVAPDEYVAPEKASNRAQLAASLDALALVTLEAARRADPDARLLARVRQRIQVR